MTEPQSLGNQPATGAPDANNSPPPPPIPSGIVPLDDRTGGLPPGGSYLIVGTPGPAKMVTAFQFLLAGLAKGEPALMLSNADDEGVLGVARAWGFDLEPYWESGQLKLIGFKDDFELRAIRSIEPGEVVEELDQLAGPDVGRIAVDPGSLFLAGGVKSLLGSTFLKWARKHPATVCTTFSVDGTAGSLPSSADWVVHATTGRLLVEWRSEDLYQMSLVKSVPDPDDRDEHVSVQLKPGAGLVQPERQPARRGRDRPGVDENRLLLVSLGGEHAGEVETWAQSSFDADVVTEPFDAVARVQEERSFGGVLIHAPRIRVREAVKACRALRPLTRAAVVFTSDDAVRSMDRIHILEAGADDCLSGGIDFRELDLRIKQAIANGSKPVPPSGNGAGGGSRRETVEGGRLERDEFVTELERRARDPLLGFFCVLDVSTKALAPSDLEELLVDQVRADAGDLVCSAEEGCLVLLQGAREGQLTPFLQRLRSRIGERAGEASDTDLELDVLSHPADSTRIRSLLGIEVASEG